MAFGRVNETWNHTASLMAAVIACHSDPKGDPPTVAQFHPYLPEPEPAKATPELLQAIGFIKRER